MESRGGLERLRTHQDVVDQMTSLKRESRVHGDKAGLLSIKSLILALSHSSGLNKYLDITFEASHGTVQACLCDLALAKTIYYYMHAQPLLLCLCAFARALSHTVSAT